MLKKSIRNTLSVTSLMLFALVISGCSHSPSVTPVSTIQKNFTNDLDVEILKDAVTKAAEKNDWDIMDSLAQSVNLKKTYIVKKRGIPTRRADRRYKHGIKKEVYVNVDINEKSVTIKPLKNYEQSFKNDSQRKQFNQELAKLEDAIYLELVPHLL
jgi:hypothetical protein